MAAKKHVKRIGEDLSKWNFIIFLTLSFMLLVAVTYSLNRQNFDLRSEAKLRNTCVNPTYPSNWKAKKAHCIEVEKGTFSWDVDSGECRLIPVCKTDTNQ
jgi:hypothetical protein